MPRKSAKSRKPRTGGKPKFDSAQTFTDEMIASLEAVKSDPKAWSAPWTSMARYGMPRNGNSGRIYRGILNLWQLLGKCSREGWTDNRWFTYKGAQSVGGQVRKGEKGTYVHAWNFSVSWEDMQGNRVWRPTAAQKASGQVKCVGQRPFLKIWKVFNADQCDGIAALPEAPQVDPAELYATAVAALDLLPVTVRHGSNVACYSPSSDEITMPEPGQFDSVEAYLATRFHETGHWTGAKSRMDRDLTGRFGSDSYAMEELVAELTSAFLCGHFGIEGQGLQHPKYLAHWLRVLKADKYAIFKPARMATEAANFILAGGVKVAVADEPTATADAANTAPDSEGDQTLASAA
ncbi:zincin-like metallopeptidase domain-containing protein [Deltaproteobacteria bacterium]|nr:zincin-like metallopeptidase domain-containing protein [Deltaproteobacteria bacterium]